MEATRRLLPPSWSDGVFYIVGAIVSTVFLLRLLHEIFKQVRLYLLPRVGRQKDYVSLYGKWAVITGGSDGIGKCYARELAKRGMNICVISNFENSIVQYIKHHYDVDVKWLDIDFSSINVYDQIEKELSQLDDIGILINNVGIVNQSPQPLAETDRKFLMKILNVNSTSTMLMTEIVLKKMVQRDRGLIVNMCSLAARVPLPYFTMYASTKAFIENYSAGLASELSGINSNVRVKCLEPFFVRTQLIRGIPTVTKFLEALPMVHSALLDAPKFAASATATFGVDTPVFYAGHWTQETLTFLFPFSLGKTVLADGIMLLLKWLKTVRK